MKKENNNIQIMEVKGGFCAAPGFLAWGTGCGIRKGSDRKDLALLYCEKDCQTAAVYTKNKVKAAPLYINMEHLRDGIARAVVVNSGNANACAPKGKENAKRMCQAAAKALGITDENVLAASTGIIGQTLPVERIESALPDLAASLSAEGGDLAAEAILTTDTYTKQAAVQVVLSGKTVTIGAMAKGSGMIHPDMGTMLCFVGTDAAMEGALLQKCLLDCVEKSFNHISVDGDTSTNDMVLVMASATAGNPLIRKEDEDYAAFSEALLHVLKKLAVMIAGDGEGAGRLVTCTVYHAPSEEAALGLAKSVITSSLVKTAMFGRDANWGRVLCAMGYAGQPLSPEKVDVYFKSSAGEIKVCENGEGLDFDEELASRVLTEKEVVILADLKEGEAEATAWGCDLTYDYVKINGDYRS